MSDIYIKPVIDIYNSSNYIIMDKGIKHPLIIMSRIELEDLVEKAQLAMRSVDDYLLEHPAKVEP